MPPIKRPAGYMKYRAIRKQNLDRLRYLFKEHGADYKLFREKGFSASEVSGIEYNYLPKKELIELFRNKNPKATAKQKKESQLTYEQLEQIRNFRIPAKKLLEAGYTPLELLAAKYSYSDLRAADVDVISLKKKVDAFKSQVKDISKIKKAK
jgi:hypothetical protein